MWIEGFLGGGDKPAIVAHLDEIEPVRRAPVHPVHAFEFAEDAVDRAFDAKGFATADAVKRLFLPEDARRGGGAERQARDERDHFLRASRLAQAALHAGFLGEAKHRPVGIVRKRAGRACGDAGKAQRTAVADLNRAERRPRGQVNHFGFGGSRAPEFVQRKTQHVAPASRRFEARGAPDARAGPQRPQRIAECEGIVGLDRRDAGCVKPETGEYRLCQRYRLVEARWIVARLGAQQNPHCRRAIGEGGGDAFEPDLRHLVDDERQYVPREAVAVPGERIDHRAAVRLVVEQQDRRCAARLAINREQCTQFAQQRIGGRQGVTRGTGRTDRGALAAAGADLRVYRDMIAVWYDRTRRTEI